MKKACDNLCDVLNGAALKHLQNEEHEAAKQLLKKAEALSGPDDLITAVTYNNIACYFRRKGKLRTALSYLEKAQRIEMRVKTVSNPAGTRLNLCAVLSQLDRSSIFICPTLLVSLCRSRLALPPAFGESEQLPPPAILYEKAI